jgi:hypothetical protein
MTTNQISRIIRNRQAQGFSPRAIAHQLQIALEKEQIVNQHLCHDCGLEMEMIEQPMFRGGNLTLITCKNPNCLLETVTLSPDQFKSSSEDQLEAYREMNRQRRSEGR